MPGDWIHTEELLADYRATAIDWDAAQGADATEANRLFDHLHGLFKEIRVDEAGRPGIAALMGEENVGLRLMAASHSLGWAPTEAAEVLEGIASAPGLHAVTAKYTLKSFREGRLSFDW